mgnify:FL=1
MKKIIIISLLSLLSALLVSCSSVWEISNNSSHENKSSEKQEIIPKKEIEKVVIENINTTSDKDQDGINDIDELLSWARIDVKNKSNYKSRYISWGYPPEGEWVCTDVIWRAFKEAGYDLKKLVDSDIQNFIKDYPRVNNKPDGNIDFRRVPNLQVYFKKYHNSLTKEIKPWDKENLKSWQPGDIVIFWKPVDHIWIISDKRNNQGVPFLIHNAGPYAKEEDIIEYWDSNISKIIGHYRIKY